MSARIEITLSERVETHPRTPNDRSPVLPCRSEVLAAVAPLEPPHLVRVFLQDVCRDSREGTCVSWVCIDEEGEGLGWCRWDGVVPLLVCLRLAEESRESMLREHDAWRDAVCARAPHQLRVFEERRGEHTLQVDEELLSRRAGRAVPTCSLPQVFRRRAHDQAAGVTVSKRE